MRKAWKALARTWRYLGWKHAVIVAAAGTLISLSVVLSTLQLNLERKHLWYVDGFRWYSVMALVFVVAVAFVEANAPRRRPPLRRYVLAAFAASVLCITGAYAVADIVMKPGYRRTTPGGSAPKIFTADQRRPTAVFAIGFEGVMHCVIGLFIYVRLRNARLNALALQRRQARAQEASRASVAAQWETMSRRVDPVLLTQTLDDIDRAYSIDPRHAEARLDELIEFLRAAIPQTRPQQVATLHRQSMEEAAE